MSSLESIKLKLRKFFISSSVSPDDIPLRIFQVKEKIVYQYQKKATGEIWTAESIDGFNFNLSTHSAELPQEIEGFPKAVAIPGFEKGKKKAVYFGERSIGIAYFDSKNGWKAEEKPLIISAKPLELAQVYERPDGNLVFYYSKQILNGQPHYDAYMALFDKKKPEELIWELEEPIWEQKKVWSGKKVVPLGSILHKGTIMSYWFVNDEVIYAVAHTGFLYDPKHIRKYKLNKHIANPIIAPNEDNSWESFTTFNPAALYADGKVHILYRAQGYDYVSAVGYASSSDGVSLDERSPHPVFAPQQDFETNKTDSVNYDFMSGGSYGGCEDPRITQIDDRVYMIYVAFDGWSPPRLALTSIHINDFLAQRWNWEKPVLISRPGIVDKSGCLLPEKINGQYVIFHRVFPNIQIDFVDDLNFDGQTKFLKGEHEIKIRPDKWDSRKIGAGAPPLKTKDGWLLIYYGVDDRDDSKYLIGAMLLDLEDPTKVLYRTDHPIVEPVEHYENIGFKPGIVYPCGAVVIQDQLLVYYGGADSHVCVATADLNEFLEELTTHKTPQLHSFEVREVTYQ